MTVKRRAQNSAMALLPRIKALKGILKRRLLPQYMRVLAPFSSNRVLPDFLISGAMRSGTTSLFHVLAQHPGIVAPKLKEIHYFDSPRNFRMGESWYRTYFPTRQRMNQLSDRLGYAAFTGEATPAMIVGAYAESASALLPNAKVIMILRNPIDRAYSHYQHQKRRIPQEKLSFWEALQKEPERTVKDLELNALNSRKTGPNLWRFTYIERGKYIDQIGHWLNFFPREQLMILNFESLQYQPHDLYNRVCHFLELPRHDFDTTRKMNTGGYSAPMDGRSRDYLTELYRPYNRRLFEFLGEDWGWPS